MNQKWYWTELIGFDRTQPDFGVKEFIERVSGDIYGISLFICDIDFVNEYDGLDKEIVLKRGARSYGGHPFNEEHEIQDWTNFEVKKLVDTLHEHGVKVLLSIFDIYKYQDENGDTCEGTFMPKHPELRFFSSVKGYYEGHIFIMKRFADGSFYRDFYISQLKRVLVDYGFDGHHFGDGLSTPRFPIQRLDFSDDIIDQYVSMTGVKLPEEYLGKCDDDKEKHTARYHYIMENQRYEFTMFISDWFADMYKRLAAALQPINKPVVFNIAWARDPFEALYRYGVDYGKFEQDGIIGMMVEDVGSSMTLLSQMGLGGFQVPLKERMYSNYDLLLTQMTIKAHAPGLMQWNMTTLKDTNEDWNLIDTAPYELHKLIVRRNNAWYTNSDGFERSSNGAFYCLSDGIPKEKWDKIKKWEDFADLGEMNGVMGLTAIWEPSILHDEVKRFIKTRKPSSKRMLDLLTYEGVSICSVVRIDSISKCKVPLLAVNAELYPDSSLEILEDYNSAPLILIGTSNPLRKQPEYIIDEGENGYKAYFYNCDLGKNKNKELEIEKKPIEVSVYDKKDGIWTIPLDLDAPHKKFFKKVRKTIDSMYIYPVVLNKCDCHMITYLTAKNKALMFITNDSYSAEDVQIHFPGKLHSVRSLCKPDWYKCRHDDESMYLHLNNRAMEVFEIEFTDIPKESRLKKRKQALNPYAFNFVPKPE